jgi:hypothetical protein
MIATSRGIGPLLPKEVAVINGRMVGRRCCGGRTPLRSRRAGSPAGASLSRRILLVHIRAFLDRHDFADGDLDLGEVRSIHGSSVEILGRRATGAAGGETPEPEGEVAVRDTAGKVLGVSR